MKYSTRFEIALLMGALAVMATGCSTLVDGLVDGMIDSAVETTEEGHIRSDKERLSRGEPLKYHRDKADLRSHEIEEELWDDEW